MTDTENTAESQPTKSRGFPLPRICLAALNLAVMYLLFKTGLGGPLFDTFDRMLAAIGIDLDHRIREGVFCLLLAPFLLPMAVFFVVPIIAFIPPSPGIETVVYGLLLINGILWAEMVLYLRRVIKTGSHRQAVSQVFTNEQSEADDEVVADSET